jgi:hypothetical protein
MIRYKSFRQLSISEFKMPFEAKLDENNRRVVLSKIVLWEEFALLYYKNYKSNQVEEKFGQGKRGYGLNDIRAGLSSTSRSWIGAIIFVMNLIRHMRDIPLPYFVSLLQKIMKVRNINIYPVKPQMKLCA